MEGSKTRLAGVLIFVLALALRLYGITFGLDFTDVDRTVLNNNIDERDMVYSVQRNLLHANLDPGSFVLRGPGAFLIFGAADAACVAGVALKNGRSLGAARAALEANPSLHVLVHRSINALAGALTAWLVFHLARREFGRRAALAAGLLFACAYMPVRDAHYGTVDVLWTLPGLWSLGRMLVWQREPDERKHALWIGAALGASAAIKYHGVFLVLPFLVSAWRVSRGVGSSRARVLATVRSVVAPAAVALVVWFALSPGIFVAPETFRRILTFQVETNTSASQHFDPGRALVYHFRYSFWYGLGEPACVLAFLGVVVAWRSGGAARWLALCAALLSPLLYVTSFHPVRYAMGLMPLLALFAGLAFERASAFLATPTAAAGLFLVLVPSLARSLTLGWLLPRFDTRVEMLDVLRARGLPSDDVLAVGTHIGLPDPTRRSEQLFVKYGQMLLGARPERGQGLRLDARYEERFERLLAAPPRLILWDLTREELELPGKERLEELVRTRYREILRLDGRRRMIPLPPSSGGLHLVPYEDPWAMTRPGPPLVLYERVD